MAGIIINTAAVFIGAAAGIFLKKYISKKHMDSILLIMSLYIVVIGIQGAIETKSPMQMLLALVLGSIVGVSLKIYKRINRLSDYVEDKFKSSNANFSQGFITAAMLQCIGALAIIGPLNAALKADMTALYIKSALDMISSLIFASIYGSGVILSGVAVFIYQGIIYLLAGKLQVVLTPEVINEVSATGSVLIMALGLELLEIKKFKIANYLPAVFMPMIFYGIRLLLGI